MLVRLLALPALALLAAAQSVPQILVYTKTAGYYHESIPTASAAIVRIGAASGLFNATVSNDETLFTDAGLAPFRLIAFLSNSDSVLDGDGERALTTWLATTGGSLVGLHAGAACLFNDTAFGVALGSWFDYHPDLQDVTFTKLVDHPTVAMLPSRYTYLEEAHHFRSDPRSVGATVLLSFDSSLVDDPRAGTRPYFEGSPPPIAWYRDRGSVDLTNGTGTGAADEAPRMTGRTWFSSLGHTTAFWEDDLNLQHVEAGLRWALEGLDDVANSTTSPSTSSATTPASTSSTGATSSSPASSAPPSTSPSSTSSARRMYSSGAPTLALVVLAAALGPWYLSRLA
ncbi:hypothetical protein JCM8208_004728 [Rhodotorula glutinis]